MPQNKKNTAYFQTLFSQMDEMLATAVTQEELVDTVKAILDTVKAMEGRLTASVAKTKDNSDVSVNALRSEIRALETRLSRALDETRTSSGQTLAQSIAQLREEMSQVQAQIPELPDYTDRFTEIESKIPTLPPEKLGEDYRNALEAIPDEEDKLKISAIGYLEARLRKLEQGGKSTVTGGGIVGRDIFKDYDLSPYLDGVTKTFNIPAVWNIISVHTSSFPNALRKGIDFNYDTTSITFTDEIDAATTLATGQTVVLTIVTG